MNNKKRIVRRSRAVPTIAAMAAIAAMLAATTAIAQTDTTWTRGNSTNNWNEADNWSAGVPVAGFNAIFGANVGGDPNQFYTLAADKITFASGNSAAHTLQFQNWNANTAGTFIEVQATNSGAHQILPSRGGGGNITLQAGTSTILNNGSNATGLLVGAVTAGVTGSLRGASSAFSTLVVDGSGITTLGTNGNGTFTIANGVSSGTLSVTKSGSGVLNLSGSNTFSGGLTLQGTGAINLSHSNAAGTGTIFLKYASSAFVAKTLGISGGIAVTNAIQIDSTTGREAIVSSGTGNNSLTGGITITGAGSNSILFANDQSSGNLTVSGGISGASYNNIFSLRGTQAGNAGFLNGAVTLGSSALFDNNGATSWTLNTAGSTWGQTLVRSSGNLVLGANNALATNARVTFDVAASTGGVDLNGFNQTVAGIETTVTPTTGNGGRITNGGSADSTLTLAGLSADRSFAGTITDGATNKTSLVMNSSGRTQTLTGNNTFSGTTTNSAGTLVLSNQNALQNSTLTMAGGALTFHSSVSGNAFSLGGLAASSNGSGFNIALQNNAGTPAAIALTVGLNHASTTYAGNLTGGGSLTKNGTGTLSLSGANTYSGTTTVNAGILNFQTSSAKSASTSVTVGATGTLGLGVGGTGFFNSADVDNLFAGTLSGVTMNSTSGVAIDTTAGNFTYSTNQSNNRTLIKIGANTLTLNGSNSYGNTTISQGVLQIGSGGTTGTLGTGTVTNNGTLAFNRSDAYGGPIANTISGTGALALASGTLTLNGSNSYTGGTQINGGILKMGSATALGGNATSVTVASGGSLDLNGQTMTTATAYALTLNGTGASGGGALLNTGATATYFGTVTLAGDSSITVASNTLNLGNATSANGVTGNYALTVGGGAGTQLTVFGNIQTASVTMNSTGTLRLESQNAFAGGLTLKSGNTVGITVGSFGGNGTGIIYLGDTAGSSSVILSLRVANGTFTNPVIVQAGSSGTAQIDNYANYNPTLSGNVTLNKSVTLANTNTSGAQNLTLNGTISGIGGVRVNSSNATGTVTLGGANTYTGNTTVNAGVLVLGNALALQNSVLVTSGNGNIRLAGGIATPTFGGLSGTKDLSSVITGNYSQLSSLTLNATTGSIHSYSGNITDGAAGMTLTKTGAGTQVLTGNNTYSGGTSINSGTLVLGHIRAAGTGNITQFSGSSLLTIDTTGTISNNMSVSNVQALQSATLNGAITVNNATWDIDTGDTLTISGNMSGTGALTKAGSGTLTLSGNNTYTGNTVITSGTLKAAHAGALGSNNTVQVTGGTLLVTADDALEGKNITLNTQGVGLQFSGNYSGSIGSLTLSANSSIDLGPDSVRILIQGLDLSTYTLSLYNWSGLPLSEGGTGADTDKVFLLPAIDPADLNKISFYSGNYGTDSFLGTGYDLGLKATGFTPAWGYQIIPVPEAETWIAAVLILVGMGIAHMQKRRRHQK